MTKDYACGILRTKFSAEMSQWHLAEKKALTWLKREVSKFGIGDNVDLAAVVVQFAQSVKP